MNQEFKHKHSPGSADLPEAIRQVKDNTLNILLHQLGDMFASCDDLFFDLSGRAQSNHEQNLYFESMREVRLKKGGLTAGFKREVDAQYHELLSNIHLHRQAEPELTASTLSLIENDQLEQKVAISSMATKAKARCQEELYHLNCRFDYLVSHKTVNDKNNPLDPELICQAFSKASAILDLNIKARIILLKQFDRYVIAKLPRLYEQANQLLINAGVLPKIKSTINKQADSSASNHDSGEEDYSSEEGMQGTGLTELRNLLHGLRSIGINIPSIVSLVPGYRHDAPKLPRSELVHLLSQLQRQQAIEDANLQDISNALDIRESIKQILLSKQEEGKPGSIEQPDEDIINLVAMFFDFVLDDKNIPIPIQALIGRLQLPVLKIALRNKAFFNNKNHPARCLINEIASASVGWNEATKHKQDHLFEKIASIVQIIHDDYVDNENIFQEQLVDLKEYLSQDNRKASLVEKRASEAAVGHAKTQHAREIIQQLLDDRIDSKTLPTQIIEFLNNQWKQVLFLIHLREGDQSVKWLESVQVVDDLIWSMQPHDDEKSSDRLKHLLPSLYKRIDQSLSLVSTSANDNNAAIEELKKLHTLIIDKRLDEISLSQSSKKTPLDDATSNSGKPWNKMTAVEKQKAKYQKLEYDFIKTAEKMPIGTWIEFSDGTAAPIRCKLTAKVEVSDSYIFVNRFGSKVMEKSRKQFAYELQKQQAKVLEKGPIFDRAIHRISSNLMGLKESGTK